VFTITMSWILLKKLICTVYYSGGFRISLLLSSLDFTFTFVLIFSFNHASSHDLGLYGTKR